MTESWQEINERLERRDKEIQRRILSVPGSERYLKTLVRAGASEARLLRLLCFAVSEKGSWRKPMRRQKQELESIASQLETVAKHAQRLSLNYLSYGAVWLVILGINQEWDKVRPPSEVSPAWLFGFMRAYAKNCRDKAKAFGDLLRKYPPRQNRQMLDCLILEVWLRTGKYHDKEIAFLLTNAYEAVGRNQEVSEDQIKKHRQRYVMPRIKAYLLSHPVLLPPGQGTLRTP